MNKNAYFIAWDELSAIALSKEEAINYVETEANKINAQIKWCKNEFYHGVLNFCCHFGDNLGKETYEIYEAPLIERK